MLDFSRLGDAVALDPDQTEQGPWPNHLSRASARATAAPAAAAAE